MKPILLFDIDGTLLHIKRDFLSGLIKSLFDEFDLDYNSVKSSSFAGRTDKDIFYELIKFSGLTKIDFDLIKKLYINLMRSQFSKIHMNPIAGAVKAAKYAKQNGYEVGLCTGNFEEIAFLKVETAGMEGLFEFGGFGCNHTDRKYLPGEARNSYQKKYSRSPEPKQFIVIGDTPNDIRCAKYYGARSIAVTTGSFDKSHLRKYQPDLILDSLEQPEKWLAQFSSP